MPTTTRGAFPYPAGADNWKQVRSAMQSLADRIAMATSLWRQGAGSGRGNAGAAGTIHHATDSGQVSLDTGTAWLALLTEAGGIITSAAAGLRGLVIKGAVGQAANLQEWQSSTGTVLAAVNPDGLLLFSGTSTDNTAGPALTGDGAFLQVIVGGAVRKIQLRADS